MDKVSNIIQKAVKIYGIKKIALSFNGGKDGLVLLHIFRGIVGTLNDIPVLFVRNTYEFYENLEYINKIKTNF